MRLAVNRMAMCEILVPSKQENLEVQNIGGLARGKNKGA